MANTKDFYTRIQNKHDTEENWNNNSSFIPMQGEIIIYDIDENYNYERMKIGDGNTSVINLPFIDIINQSYLDDFATKIYVEELIGGIENGTY